MDSQIKHKETDPDYDAVCASQGGNLDAFESLVEKYQKSLFNLAMRVLGNGKPEDAEDVVQDVFLNVFKKISAFEYRSLFSTYIYRVAVNTSLNHKKKIYSKAAISIDDENNTIIPVDKDLTGDEQASLNQLYDDFMECVEQLKEPYKTVFKMKSLKDCCRYEDLAEIFEKKVNTLKTQVKRAREAVKKCLENKYGDLNNALP